MNQFLCDSSEHCVTQDVRMSGQSQIPTNTNEAHRKYIIKVRINTFSKNKYKITHFSISADALKNEIGFAISFPIREDPVFRVPWKQDKLNKLNPKEILLPFQRWRTSHQC